MKKNSMLWVAAVCAVLMLGGCVSSATHVPYASTAPLEASCTINIINTLTVRTFDGEAVQWSPKWGYAWASVQIPAGKHTFVVDYERSVHNDKGVLAPKTRHYLNNITISHDHFIAGHTYEIIAAEGAEAQGFVGLFTNPLQAMQDTAGNTLRIVIRDVTQGVDRTNDVLFGPFS
jgi:hypothetical protein